MSTEFQSGFGQGETGAAAGRAAAEQAFDEMDAETVDFAVVFSTPGYDCETVAEGVQSVTGETTLIGATADAQFTHRGVHTSSFMGGTGVSVALVASDEMQFFTGLGRNATDDPEGSVAEAAADLPTDVEGFPHQTGIILTSTVFGQEELVLQAYQELPIEWTGGGAADVTLENPVVYTDEETATDAVLLTVIASKQEFGLGVGNRHSPIGGSYEVTKSEGDIVYELDGRPAYEVWKDAFRDVVNEQYSFSFDQIENDQMLRIKAFTELVFGLRTGEDQYKVRSAWVSTLYEPYAVSDADQPDDGYQTGETSSVPDLETLGTLPDGALKFAHSIPEGVVLYPMTSGKDGTIERGVKSARHALEVLESDSVAGGLAFECPCGEVTLMEDYTELIDATTDPVDAPMAGIQSGGDEVCFRRDDMRGLHETATTMLLFPGGEST